MRTSPWPSVDFGLRHGLPTLDGPLSLDAVSAAAGYSRFHFSRLVRRASGLSLATYVGRLRVLRAKRLLACTKLSVSEVALACGYSSLGTFSRRFRVLAGSNPTSFRAWVRGEAPPAAPAGARPLVGVVVCDGWFVGHVHIGLFPTADCVGRAVAETVIQAPGSFELQGVPEGAHYAFAAACCCHPGYAGDMSQTWAIAGPVKAGDGGGTLQLHLRTLHPADAPVVATFGNGGEARPCAAGLACGLRPIRGEAGGPMVRGIASVLVYVRDMDASIDFYSQLLGVPVAHRDPTVAQFSAGTLRLVLHRDKLPSRAGVRGAMEFDLEVSDAAAFHAELAGRGMTAPAPVRQPWGWTGFPVRDPDGNVVEVYEIPG